MYNMINSVVGTSYENMNCTQLISYLRKDLKEIMDLAANPFGQYFDVISTQNYIESKLKELDEPEDFCLVSFENSKGICNHVGLYFDDQIIHSTKNMGVIIEKAEIVYSRYEKIRFYENKEL